MRVLAQIVGTLLSATIETTAKMRATQPHLRLPKETWRDDGICLQRRAVGHVAAAAGEALHDAAAYVCMGLVLGTRFLKRMVRSLANRRS